MLKTFRLCVQVATLIAVILLAGCARLPEYGRPQYADSSEQGDVLRKGFGYRLLSIEDFQAESLPEPYAEHRHHIQARSCISLRSSANSAARISRGEIGGNVVFIGRFYRISFEAVFNPVCSWWNPEVRRERIDYVLQHEQIHFALTEITARRLNSEGREDILGFMAIGSNPEEVGAQLQGKLKAVSRESMEEDIAVHTAFDEATSLFFDPVAQQKWFERVVEDLNLLKNPAVPNTTDKTKNSRLQGSAGG